MLKYFIRGVIYGLVLGIVFPILASNDVSWAKGLLISGLAGLVIGGCELVLSRILFPKRVSSG